MDMPVVKIRKIMHLGDFIEDRGVISPLIT